MLAVVVSHARPGRVGLGREAAQQAEKTRHMDRNRNGSGGDEEENYGIAKPNLIMEEQQITIAMAAAALGRLSKGKPKTLTPEQREAKRKRMMRYNAQRAEAKKAPQVFISRGVAKPIA